MLVLLFFLSAHIIPYLIGFVKPFPKIYHTLLCLRAHRFVYPYDMVLAELGCEKNRYPDFLVHDSTIFDGVDERQVARALILAQLKCDKLGYQYICLVNSDMIPYQEFDDEFTSQFNSNIVLKISDDQENGGLLGIRF